MRKPTFFILGAPKCGTTALAQYLSSHPDIFLSLPKEPHFFDAGFDRGMDRYLKEHYSGWRDERAAGEATPSYLSVPYVAERIHQEVPHAKLIVLLRNPIERAFSSWWMFHIRGMEPLSFSAAIAAEEQLLLTRHPLDSDNAESMWKAHVRRLRAGNSILIPTYLYNGLYARHLRHYYQLFPQQNIKVVFSHQLRVSPADTIRDLWQFIGVAPHSPLPKFDAVNEAIGSGAKPILRLLQATGLMRMRNLLPSRTRSWIKKELSRGEKPTMDSGTQKHLAGFFEPYTRDLESLLGEDLSNWRHQT